MQRIIGRIKSKKIFLLTSLLYAIGAVLLFPYLRFYVDNPDTISYITLARKYAHADFSNAVNGYWSPLISWMLGFLLKWRGDEIITFKILQLLIGWFALFNFVKLVHVVIHSKTLQLALSLACIPFMLSYSLLNLTPDLLFLSVILFYLNIVSEKEFFNHRHFGLIAGVLGVLMYFSKSFGFCFFLAHFTVLFLKNFFSTKEFAFKRHLINNYFQAIISFVCVSSIWIYLISDKYHHFTISENVSYNLSKEVAAAPEKENKLPVLSEGLYKPTNATSVNAWEDPGLTTNITPLHPFSIANDFRLYQQVLKRNLLSIYYSDFRRQIGYLFLFTLAAFLIAGKRKRFFQDDYFFSLFLAVLFVYGGYALILVHARYVWVCSLLMILLNGWCIEEIHFKNRTWQILAKVAFLLVVFLFAVKRPIKEILFAEDKDTSVSTLFSSMLHPFETMGSTYSPDRVLFDARREMKSIIKSNSTIASIKNSESVRDGYTQASLLALSLNANYLGQVSENDSTLSDQLAKFKVAHLISFSEDASVTDSLRWRVVYNNTDLPMKIYSRRN